MTTTTVNMNMSNSSHETIHLYKKIKLLESFHNQNTIIFNVIAITLSVILVYFGGRRWTKTYPKSYHYATLILMWLFPILVSINNNYKTFSTVWTMDTVVLLTLTFIASPKQINGRTRKFVITTFDILYKTSYVLCILGWFTMLLSSLSFDHIFDAKSNAWNITGLLFFYYGIYFGVLNRDIAEIVYEKMVTNNGYYRKLEMPFRNLESDLCAVCGNSVNSVQTSSEEKSHQLACSHTFHEVCLVGWCMLGKKLSCAYCKQKLDFNDPANRSYPSNNENTVRKFFLIYLKMGEMASYYYVGLWIESTLNSGKQFIVNNK